MKNTWAWLVAVAMAVGGCSGDDGDVSAAADVAADMPADAVEPPTDGASADDSEAPPNDAVEGDEGAEKDAADGGPDPDDAALDTAKPPELTCDNVSFEGCCTGLGSLVYCEGDQLQEGNCADSDLACGWDPTGADGNGWYACVANAAPEPAGEHAYLCLGETCIVTPCEGQTCGYECGETCGTCSDTEYCTEANECLVCACGEKQACGVDACGKPCGQCKDAEYCTAEDNTCEACDCGDDACGVDQCGVSCGECGAADFCALGQCYDSIGSCTSNADKIALSEADSFGVLASCGLGCLSEPDPIQCATDCSQEGLGVTAPCAECLGDTLACAIANCVQPCVSDPGSAECTICRQEHCDPAFFECAGISSIDPTPDPVGACCQVDASCLDVSKADCLNTGVGGWLSEKTCADVLCPDETQGVCCFTDGTCEIATADVCGTVGGFSSADECGPTACDGVSPKGACCHADGSCEETFDKDCQAAGDKYGGADTTCADAACAPPG